jgi:hypothetical protein
VPTLTPEGGGQEVAEARQGATQEGPGTWCASAAAHHPTASQAPVPAGKLWVRRSSHHDGGRGAAWSSLLPHQRGGHMGQLRLPAFHSVPAAPLTPRALQSPGATPTTPLPALTAAMVPDTWLQTSRAGQQGWQGAAVWPSSRHTTHGVSHGRQALPRQPATASALSPPPAPLR